MITVKVFDKYEVGVKAFSTYYGTHTGDTTDGLVSIELSLIEGRGLGLDDCFDFSGGFKSGDGDGDYRGFEKGLGGRIICIKKIERRITTMVQVTNLSGVECGSSKGLGGFCIEKNGNGRGYIYAVGYGKGIGYKRHKEIIGGTKGYGDSGLPRHYWNF